MVLVIVVLVFSILTVAVPALVQCLRCPGAGKMTSQSYIVYGSTVQPDVTRIGIQAGGNDYETNVTGIFRNNENVEVYGVATAVVVTSPSASPQTQSSNRTLLPAKGTVYITITYHGLKYEHYYSCLITFAAEPITGPTGGSSGVGTQTASPYSGGTGGGKGGFNFASIGVPLIAVAAVVVGSMGGILMFRKTRLSEEKVRRFTSYDYQYWVMQRLGGHAGSVLDSRKGIDGFTGDNVPVAIKQSDSVGRLQVDSFMNALTQTKVRRGLVVAFGFDSEAYSAADRAKLNRIDITLVTVKELIEHKGTVLL
jgi:hypothetical protein